MQNKLEKFLIALSGIFAVALGITGMKLKDDNKKMNELADAMDSYSSSISDIIDQQKQIMSQRQETLDKIANAPAPDTTKTVTTRTVVPGKVVQQKVPKSSSSSSSSKTTKSS